MTIDTEKLLNVYDEIKAYKEKERNDKTGNYDCYSFYADVEKLTGDYIENELPEELQEVIKMWFEAKDFYNNDEL